MEKSTLRQDKDEKRRLMQRLTRQVIEQIMIRNKLEPINHNTHHFSCKQMTIMINHNKYSENENAETDVGGQEVDDNAY